MSKSFWAALTVVLIAAAGAAAVAPVSAHAGVFDLPSFIEPGQWSLGLEPEVSLSNGTGAALNLKPRIGVSDLLDWEFLIGTGSGARKFRVGATADFEWFPDYEGQPGIATPLFVEYYRIDEDGLLSFGVKPMVYKTFEGKDAEYTPFFSIPLGWNLRNSKTETFIQIAMGSMFKVPGNDHWKFTLEAGFNAKDSYSYISGGVTYYH